MTNELFLRALNLSYFFLKFRPRTEKEVRDYLTKKSTRFHFGPEIIDKVIRQLINEDLINDNKFIIWFVDQRNRTKPKSTFVLKGELFKLGIDKNLIDQYFEKTEVDEFNLAKRALARKMGLWQNIDEPTRFKKAINFLLSRGFSYSISKTAYNQINTRE